MNDYWSTRITEVKANQVRLRGYRIDELMGEISFAQAIVLALLGELPSPQQQKVFEAILVACIDHGATPPSVLAARTSASTGAPLNAAVAAGVLSINRYHGAAIEDCMRTLEEALKLADHKQSSFPEAAARLLAAYKQTGRRVPGLGHRIHDDDPRAARLFTLAQQAGCAGMGVAMLEALQEGLRQSGKELPINVDGAIAALLLDLDVPAGLGNAFFIMARVPGLIAHVHEEITQERPMRKIDPTQHSYEGPPPRALD